MLFKKNVLKLSGKQFSDSFFLEKNILKETTVKQTFTKDEKLCSQISISEVFKKGDKYFKFPFRMYVLPKKTVGNKVLISVPKKMQKLAVSRNHLKRLTREAYRLNKNEYLNSKTESYNIAFVYLSKEIATSEQIHRSVENLMKNFTK